MYILTFFSLNFSILISYSLFVRFPFFYSLFFICFFFLFDLSFLLETKGNNRNEMHALISSWIARSSTQSCAFQIEDLCMYQVISFNYLYGKLDLCFNPMCTGTTNRACQSERQNSMLRFLERDPLKIRNKYPITQQPIFMKCADCLLTQYCSKECQKQNWKCHRPYCKATCKSSHKKSLNPSLE